MRRSLVLGVVFVGSASAASPALAQEPCFENDPYVFSVGSYAVSFGVGDLDGDGAPDLVAPNYDLGTVSVLRSLGHGLFADPVTYPAGDTALAIALGDLDGDGALDLVVSDTLNSRVSVLLNRGSGRFADPVTYPVLSDPLS